MAQANQTSLPIVVAGGTAPYTYQIVNDSDTTISASISGSNVVVDATAKKPGPYQVKVRITDAALRVSSQIIPVQVMDSGSFLIKDISFSVVSETYPVIKTFQLSSYGGQGTIFWELLPSTNIQDATIDQNGLVTTVITQQGNYTISVRATDSVNNTTSSSIGVFVTQPKPYRLVDGNLEVELSSPSVPGPRSITTTLTDSLGTSITRTFNFYVSSSLGDLKIKPYTVNHYFSKDDQGQFLIPVVGDFQGLTLKSVVIPSVLGMPVSLNTQTKTFIVQGPPSQYGNGEVDLTFDLTRSGYTVASYKKTISVCSFDGTSQANLGNNHITMRPFIVGEVVGVNPQKPWFNSPQASRNSSWEARLASGSALPPGLSLDKATGLIYGPVLSSFTQPSVIEFYDETGVKATFEITWDILSSDFNILDNTNPMHLGRTPVGSLQCQSGSPIVDVTVYRGSLPNGLTLSVNSYDPTKVDFVGAPTTVGFFDVWLRVTNSEGKFGYIYKRLTVQYAEPLWISTPTLPVATKGQSFSYTLSALGGTPPYKWSLASATTTNNWVNGPSLSGLTTNKMNAKSVVLADGSVWIGPGYDPVLGSFDDCHIFTPSTGLFSGSIVTPTKIGRYAAALSGTSVLVAGGVGVSNKCYLFDTATKVWSVAADLPAARMDMSASTLLDGSVLVCGGSDGSVPRSEVYKYNTNNTWSIMTAMPSGLTDTCQATLSDGTVLVVGVDSLNQPKAYKYTPGTNLWSTLTAPTLERCQGSSLVALAGGQALLIGGWGVVPTLLSRRETIFWSGAAWTSGPSVPTGIADASAQKLGTKIFTFGGRSTPSTPVLQSYVLDMNATSGVDSPALPTGITLSSTGALSGTPSDNSYNQNVIFMITDASGQTSTKPINLRVNSTLSVATSILPAIRSAEGYSLALTATGGQPPYTWSLSGASLPSGISLSSSGVLSGQHLEYDAADVTPTFQVTDALNATATKQLRLYVNNSSGLTIDSSAVTDVKRGCGYSATLRVLDGVAPFKWSLKGGSLPSGMVLSEEGLSQGSLTTITGSTKDIFSNTSPVVMVIDATGAFGAKQLSLSSTPSLQFLDTTLPQGRVGVAYNHTLTASTCAVPMVFALDNSSLPSGLTLSPSGLISGTPTQQGVTTVQIKVTDDAGDVISKTFTMVMSATTLSISTPTLTPAYIGKAYSCQVSASGGLAPFKWSIESGNLPSNFSLDASTGTLSCSSVGANQVGTYSLRVKVEDSDFTNGGNAYTAFKDYVLTIQSSIQISSGPDKTLGTNTGLLGVRWMGPLSGLSSDLVKRDHNSFRVFVQGWPSTTDTPTLTCADANVTCVLSNMQENNGSLDLIYNLKINPSFTPSEQTTKLYNFALSGGIGISATATFGIRYKIPPVLSVVDASGNNVFDNIL